MEKEFELKENTHIVIKVDDLVKYLTEKERFTVAVLLENKINTGRINDGKKINEYYICNVDEPYSKEVLDVIRNGEMKK